MLSLHNPQRAIWLLLYILNYTVGVEYETIWTNFNNEQPSGVPGKASHWLYYDNNSNEIHGSQQLPYNNYETRYGKVNKTNFGHYETINNKDDADPVHHDDRDLVIKNIKDNWLLNSSYKDFSLIGYDDEIYNIMNSIIMAGDIGPLLVSFYLYQANKYFNIGRVRTYPHLLDLVLSKYNHFNCINSNQIMIPRGNNIIYAHECLENCNDLAREVNMIVNEVEDNMGSYFDYVGNNLDNNMVNSQNNVISHYNNYNDVTKSNNRPAIINSLWLPQNYLKTESKIKKYLNDQYEFVKNKEANVQDDIALISNEIDDNISNINIDKDYSDTPGYTNLFTFPNKRGNDYTKNLQPDFFYDPSQKDVVALDIAQPCHLENNLLESNAPYKLDLKTFSNDEGIQTGNGNLTEANNAVILEEENVKQKYIINNNLIPNFNNSIIQNPKQMYDTYFDEILVNDIPLYNSFYTNVAKDQEQIPHELSDSYETADIGLGSNQKDTFQVHPKEDSLFSKQYLNLPSIDEANNSIPKSLAHSFMNPDINIQKISSTDLTNANIDHLNYIEPSLFPSQDETFGSENFNSNPTLKYMKDSLPSYHMQMYDYIQTNENKSFREDQLPVNPFKLKSLTSSLRNTNQYFPQSEIAPADYVPTYTNTPPTLKWPGFYSHREVPHLKTKLSQTPTFNIFDQIVPRTVSIANSNVLNKPPSLANTKSLQTINKSTDSLDIPSVSYTQYSLDKPYSKLLKEFVPQKHNIFPVQVNLKPRYEATKTTIKKPTKQKATSLISPISDISAFPKMQKKILDEPAKLTNPSLNIPYVPYVPIEWGKNNKPKSNTKDMSMEDQYCIPNIISSPFLRGYGKPHSIQTPFDQKFNDMLPCSYNTNIQNTPYVNFDQSPKTLYEKFVRQPQLDNLFPTHKNIINPLLTPLRIRYQTTPKRKTVEPSEIEYIPTIIPSLDNKIESLKLAPKPCNRDNTIDDLASVEIPKVPSKMYLNPEKIKRIPIIYASRMHQNKPTWAQKHYQPLNNVFNQNANKKICDDSIINLEGNKTQGQKPITDLCKTNMNSPYYSNYKGFSFPNENTAKYYYSSNGGKQHYLPTSNTPFYPIGNLRLTNEIFASPNKTPQIHSVNSAPYIDSKISQYIPNGITNPYNPSMSQILQASEPKTSTVLNQLYQEPNTRLKTLVPKLVLPQSKKKNIKDIPLKNIASYENPLSYLPYVNKKILPNLQTTKAYKATNNQRPNIHTPVVNFAPSPKLLHEKKYLNPNFQYYNPTSNVKLNAFITPLTTLRTKYQTPKGAAVVLADTEYVPSKISSLNDSFEPFEETRLLSPTDHTKKYNIATDEVPNLPPGVLLKPVQTKNILLNPPNHVHQKFPPRTQKQFQPISIEHQKLFDDSMDIERNKIPEKEAIVGFTKNKPYLKCQYFNVPNTNTIKYPTRSKPSPIYNMPMVKIPEFDVTKYLDKPTSRNTLSPDEYSLTREPFIESNVRESIPDIVKPCNYSSASQILQTFEPKPLEILKQSIRQGSITSSNTLVPELKPPESKQPDFEELSFSLASYEKPPLYLKSTLRNLRPSKVSTATNHQSNLNFNQGRNIKELCSDNNLYRQRNGQGQPNLAHKGPVSSSPYAHKHPSFEYTNPMWKILPRTLSNVSLEPKPQFQFTTISKPIKNTLEQIKQYTNMPPQEEYTENSKIPSPKQNIKPATYVVNKYNPKILNQKVIQPRIYKPHTTSSQTNPPLDPTFDPNKCPTYGLKLDFTKPLMKKAWNKPQRIVYSEIQPSQLNPSLQMLHPNTETQEQLQYSNGNRDKTELKKEIPTELTSKPFYIEDNKFKENGKPNMLLSSQYINPYSSQFDYFAPTFPHSVKNGFNFNYSPYIIPPTIIDKKSQPENLFHSYYPINNEGTWGQIPKELIPFSNVPFNENRKLKLWPTKYSPHINNLSPSDSSFNPFTLATKNIPPQRVNHLIQERLPILKENLPYSPSPLSEYEENISKQPAYNIQGESLTNAVKYNLGVSKNLANNFGTGTLPYFIPSKPVGINSSTPGSFTANPENYLKVCSQNKTPYYIYPISKSTKSTTIAPTPISNASPLSKTWPRISKYFTKGKAPMLKELKNWSEKYRKDDVLNSGSSLLRPSSHYIMPPSSYLTCSYTPVSNVDRHNIFSPISQHSNRKAGANNILPVLKKVNDGKLRENLLNTHPNYLEPVLIKQKIIPKTPKNLFSPTFFTPTLNPMVQSIENYNFQKLKYQQKSDAYSAPFLKDTNKIGSISDINNDNNMSTDNILSYLPSDQDVGNDETNYYVQPTNIKYAQTMSAPISQKPAAVYTPVNSLTIDKHPNRARIFTSKDILQNINEASQRVENTSNLFAIDSHTPNTFSNSPNMPQDNLGAIPYYQPGVEIPAQTQSLGNILPIKRTPANVNSKVFKNNINYKSFDPIQNVMYPVQGKYLQDAALKDNTKQPSKQYENCVCKMRAQNPTIMDQIIKQLQDYSKTLPDCKIYDHTHFPNDKITIPLGEMGLAKYEITKPNEHFVKTEMPGLFIKAWGSKIKIIKPKLVFDVKEYEGFNFMPVIKNNYYSPEFAQKIAKDIVTRLYGEPIVINGVYSTSRPFAIIDDINNVLVNDGKAYILWPTLCNCGCMSSGCRCCYSR